MDPMPPGDFAALLRHAGLTKLAPAEVEDIRHAHSKLMAMLAVLRDPPPPLAAEPALVFVPAGEETPA